MRIALGILAGLALLWAVFAGVMYSLMSGPPMRFAGAVAKLPGPTMMTLPFPAMWKKARAGSLKVGDPAPDFDLERADKSGRVRLSSLRGSRPVVLVFGSYT